MPPVHQHVYSNLYIYIYYHLCHVPPVMAIIIATSPARAGECIFPPPPLRCTSADATRARAAPPAYLWPAVPPRGTARPAAAAAAAARAAAATWLLLLPRCCCPFDRRCCGCGCGCGCCGCCRGSGIADEEPEVVLLRSIGAATELLPLPLLAPPVLLLRERSVGRAVRGLPVGFERTGGAVPGRCVGVPCCCCCCCACAGFEPTAGLADPGRITNCLFCTDLFLVAAAAAAAAAVS